MINVDIDKTLEELKGCGIDEYDLKPLMIKGVKAQFRPEIYLEDNQIELLTSIGDSFDATMQKLIEQFDTFKNAVLWHELKYICKNLSLRENEKSGMMVRRYENCGTDHDYTVQLIRYAVLNKFDKDRSESLKITDTLRNTSSFGYKSAVKFEVLGIKVQSFKNRKTIIRGLTDEQYQRIVDAFALYEKYR